MDSARVLLKEEIKISPWVCLVRKEVLFDSGHKETYHSLKQRGYVAILALTPDNKIPVIRQFRPALETYTWELPAGILEEGEQPEQACQRELLEETGLKTEKMIYLGHYDADTGRLENEVHSFLVQASQTDPSFIPEPGLQVQFLTLPELREWIVSGKFRHQHHIALLTLAALKTGDNTLWA